MIRQRVKGKLLKIRGVRERLGYIVVDENFLRQTFTLVKDELEGIVERYKQWGTKHRASQQPQDDTGHLTISHRKH